MNYNHLYHAGNFSDVFKHLVVMLIIEKLKKKPTPFVYIDTHSAYPLTDLSTSFSQKTQEAAQGILKVANASKLSAPLRHYLKCIEFFNQDKKNVLAIRFYPGSSAFASSLMRDQDRIILNELTDEAYQQLKKTFYKDARVHCHQQDAYVLLKALLPPKEKRGLVLIDPPYEDPQEFNWLEKNLPQWIKRWPQGIYALWYPIKNREKTERFCKKMMHAIDAPVANYVLQPWPSDVQQRLGGVGMLVVNPPWQLGSAVHTLAKELEEIFKS